MPNEPGGVGEKDPKERAEKYKQQLIMKLSVQAADLVNKAKLPPGVVTMLYFDVSLALALHMGATPRDVAAALRVHAERLEALDDTEDPSPGEMHQA